MEGKRANGEGNIRKRADGRWEATVTLPTGGRKSYYRKTRAQDLVFCTEIGGALCGNHISDRAFPALIKQSGLPRIRFHDLRHTCATLLWRQGIHPKIVSEMLGHTTIAMTLDRYSHVLPDMQAGAVDALDRLLG